jgi:hypothetical protein
MSKFNVGDKVCIIDCSWALRLSDNELTTYGNVKFHKEEARVIATGVIDQSPQSQYPNNVMIRISETGDILFIHDAFLKSWPQKCTCKPCVCPACGGVRE